MDALDPKRERETLDGAPKVAGRRNRVEELKRLFVKDKQVAKHHAQWWDPPARETSGAPLISPLDGADAAPQLGRPTIVENLFGKNSPTCSEGTRR